MIRKIKPDLFRPGNIVQFNEVARPYHSCVGLKLKVIKSICRFTFNAEVVQPPNTKQFPIGYIGRQGWTKDYYIQG